MKKIENSLKCDECEKVFMTKMDFESHVSLQEKLNTTQINKVQLKYAKYCLDTWISNFDKKTINQFSNVDLDIKLEQGYAIKEILKKTVHS